MDYQGALNNYLSTQGSLARGALQARESLLAGRAGLLQGREGMMESKAGSDFARKLQEIGLKGQTGEGLAGAGAVGIPGALRKGASALRYAQAGVDSRWKTAQAERFAEGESPSPGRTVVRAPEPGEGEEPTGDIELQPVTSFKEPTLGEVAQDPEMFRAQAKASGAPEADDPEALEAFRTQIKENPFLKPEQDLPASKAFEEPKGLESAEAEVSGEVEDLAPELTGLSSALSTGASALGALAGVAGLGFGAYGIYEAIHSAEEAGKTSAEDPYAEVRGKLAGYSKQINSLQNMASADQFLEKVGRGTPSFGSMAVPTYDTSKIVGGMQHF